MELARRWIVDGSPCVPAEIRDLLESHDLTRGMVIDEGRPEFQTSLPERGEGRNHDLLLRGQQGRRRITIGLEAKTDEPFDERIADRTAAAVALRPASRVPARTGTLLQWLFGCDCDLRREPYGDLRYQLVMAAVATALQALDDGAELGVFLVQELRTWKCDEDKARQNAHDFAMFVSLLVGGHASDVQAGEFYGPVRIPAQAHADNSVTLLVGKAVSEPIRDWTGAAIPPLPL